MKDHKMIVIERQLLEELANAYRIIREAYHHDMHREPPAMNTLQIRIQDLLSA